MSCATYHTPSMPRAGEGCDVRRVGGLLRRGQPFNGQLGLRTADSWPFERLRPQLTERDRTRV